MDKLTAIKIKYDDGTYSDEIPVSVLSENVEWDSTHTLVDVLGSVDVDVAGTIQDQITQLFNSKVNVTDLSNYVNSTMKTEIATWLNNYISPATGTIAYDASLSIQGAAADAKAAGQIVQISTTKPTKENNRIWVGAAEEEYEVPTMDNIASAYDPTKTYAVGNIVSYDGNFYECITAITTAEAWTTSHWKATTTGREIADLKTNIIAGTRNLLRKFIIGSGIGPDGNILTNNPSIWYCPDYIPAGKVTIKANGSISGYSVNFRICEYDSNKIFLRRKVIYVNPTTYTPQNDCAYIRFSFYGIINGSESIIESFKLQAEYGEQATEYVSPITAYDMNARDQVSTLNYQFKNNIDNLVMLENNFTTPLNLFSPNNASLQGNGTVYPSTCTNVDNRTQASDHSFYSFYIPVKEETTYAISFAGLRVIFFDVHKNTISIEPLSSYSSAIVTTPSGCCYMGVVSNGNQSRLMVVEGDSVPSSYQTYKAAFLGEVGKNIVLSADTNEPIVITGTGNFVIDGNGYSIDLGIHLTGTQGSNYIEIPYSTTTGRIYKVCVTKELDIQDTYTVLSVGYNTTLWASYNDPTQDFRLVPVTSMSELANTSNSFYYDGTKIYINIENPAVEYVLADDEDMHYGLNISSSIGKIKDLTIKYSSLYNCIVQNGSICEFTNCHFLYSSNRGGIISASKSAVILNRCEAFKARMDGMDTTADGQVSSMIQNDCHCHYNYDDGSSHHNGKFYINGGEYDHNHKGGVSAPCYLSEGNVTGAYIHDNEYAGVYAVNTAEQGANQFIISNCLFKGNARNYHLEWYSAISYNNVYADTPPNANAITHAQLLEYGN